MVPRLDLEGSLDQAPKGHKTRPLEVTRLIKQINAPFKTTPQRFPDKAPKSP